MICYAERHDFTDSLLLDDVNAYSVIFSYRGVNKAGYTGNGYLLERRAQ